jgi:hypothetical protein
MRQSLPPLAWPYRTRRCVGRRYNRTAERPTRRSGPLKVYNYWNPKMSTGPRETLRHSGETHRAARAELRRSHTFGDPGKVCLGLVTGPTVDAVGQIVEELHDDAHMLRTDLTSRLRGGGVRQLGRQRFACYRSPRPEQLGLLDSPSPFVFGDPQFRGQNIGQRGAAQRFGIGLGGQPVDDPMVHRGQGAHHNLPPALQLQQFRVRQRIQ